MGTQDWQVLNRQTVYDGSPWVRVHREDVRLPDGSVLHGHHVIDVPRPAVGVVPVGDDGRILLIEHHRFITGTTGWEIPAGRADEGEDPAAAGARELFEETGHRAAAIEQLGKYHPSNGSSNQTFHVCVGRGVKRVGEIQDTNEVGRIAWFEREEIAKLLRANRILNGLSLTALLWFWFHALQQP